MTTETVDVRDTALFVEREPRSSFTAYLREVAQVHGVGVVTPFALVREVALLQDRYYQSAYSVLRDVALLADHVYPAVRYTVVTRDLCYIADYLSGQNTAVVTAREVATVLGYANAPPSAKLHEVALLDDVVTWFSTGTKALREVARLNDHAYPHTSVVLRELAYLSDGYLVRARARADVREVAQIGDEALPGFTSVASMREVFFGTDRVYPNVTRRPVLHETFYADDRATPPPTGRAYTCHILTFGMSQYANYPFTTQAGNYAAGQNLWRLDATKDYNKETPAWITTGMLDIGTSHGKRPSAIYAAGSSSEPLGVVVTGDLHGKLASYSYSLDLRDQTNYRNNRAILGKGFRSRYLQFRLQAPKYLGFRLLTAEVDLAVSPRRVG